MVLESMLGVLGLKPSIPKSGKLRAFKLRWRREFLKENPNYSIVEIRTYGIWAYDVVIALTMAIEAAWPTHPGPNTNRSSSSTSICQDCKHWKVGRII